MNLNCGYNVIGYTYYILWLVMTMPSGLTNPAHMLFHWNPSLLQPSEPCSEYIPTRSRNWCLHNLAASGLSFRHEGKSRWRNIKWCVNLWDCSRKRTAEPFFTRSRICLVPLWHKLSKNRCCVLKQAYVEIWLVVYQCTCGTAMILSGSVFPISAARAAPLAMESVSSSSALRSVVFRKGARS